MKCFVLSCSSDFHCTKYEDEDPLEKFPCHRIPKDPVRRNVWLQAIASAENRDLRASEINFKTVRVCSKHFRAEDLYLKNGKQRLNKSAVPTIFGTYNEELEVSKRHFEDSGFNDHQVSTASTSGTENLQLPAEQNGPPVAKRRRTLRYAGDVANQEITGEEALILLPKVQAKLLSSQKTIKLQRTQIKRLRDKLDSMQKIINKLSSKNLLSNTGSKILQNYALDDTLYNELATRTNRHPCSEQLRRFAVTLHFYSPKAYNYVRHAFNNTLPHPRTIVRWYETVDGEPGITREALDALRAMAGEQKANGKPLLGCLMMDEMAIHQQVVWNEKTKKLEGVVHHHINRGAPTTVEHTAVAKEALVFMVTGVQDGAQGTWKIPVAYFFINGMSATEKKEVIKTVMTSLQNAGVKIIALTFDGTATNIATANALGCSINGSSLPLKTTFQHPTSDHEVFVLMDPVHMLKLVRNNWHSQKVLITSNGIVEWEYIEKLNKLQNGIGVKLAPKLTDQHVNFQNSKMKVVLAVQTLSNSVAVALEQLKTFDPDFAGCGATVEFVSLFNDLFDICNSMDKIALSFKKPLSNENFDLYNEAFDYINQYIRNIRLQDGSKILNSRCKTGFLGFLVALESFKGLFKTYVDGNGELDQIFTYRFSQDHLENFFGALRSKNGSNNNPNCVQFKACYKRLIVNNEIVTSPNSNCQDFGNVLSLNMSSKIQRSNSIPLFKKHEQVHSEQPKMPCSTEVDNNDYNLFVMDAGLHAAISNHVPEIQRKLVSALQCQACSSIASKDVSTSIVAISKATDYEFKLLVGDNNDVHVDKYYDYLVSTSLLRVQDELETIFELFGDHPIQNPIDDHKIAIIKHTISIYLNIKIKLYTKSMKTFKPSNRQKLTKLILFEGN